MKRVFELELSVGVLSVVWGSSLSLYNGSVRECDKRERLVAFQTEESEERRERRAPKAQQA